MLKKRLTILTLLAVVFFFVYSYLSFQIPLNPPLLKGEIEGDFKYPPLLKGEIEGDFIFNSPDETSAYFFSRLFADSPTKLRNGYENYENLEPGGLRKLESLNFLAPGLIHPRSVLVNSAGHLVPGGFLGMPLIYGSLAKIPLIPPFIKGETKGDFGAMAIPFFTPFFAVLGVIAFYFLLRKIWDENTAFLSAVLMFFLPPFWYYSTRGMFPNVLFVSLLIISAAFFFGIQQKGHPDPAVGGGRNSREPERRPARISRVTEFIPPLAGFPPARNATQSVAGGRDSSSSPLAGTPQNDELLSIIASIPSGNFGDMMGTVIAKEMGLPVSKIICGVNENAEFPEFLETGRYEIKPTRQSPSSAMMVSHPSNLARLFDFYGGRIYDERNAEGKVSKRGVIAKMPDVDEMKKDIFSVSVANEEHYQTIKEVYEKYRIILDPHGAVGWKALDKFLKSGGDDKLSVIYETADPAKFPEDVKKAIGISPEVPEGIKKQAHLEERIYYVNSEPDVVSSSQTLSESQYNEAKNILRNIFKK